jgi:tRNA A-37 threonylcarbamoyl transferase component Bud32
MDDPVLSATPRLVVANRYMVDLDALIGSGGMALVYRGLDMRTRRPVAMKTLRVEYRRDADSRTRFRREIRTLAFLTHRNVVKIFDLYEDDAAPWAIMEFIEGRSLKDIVQERGRLTLEETSSVLEQTADALDYLHSKGLVHLDVKPQNLLVQPDGLVKLIDFGLAQPAQTPQELIGGSTFGTVAYLAPEQASGEKVDVQTDVYALGCVVYEMLTGRTPFDADDDTVRSDIIRAHLEDDPVLPSQVEPVGKIPGSIDPIIIGALMKRPHDRYRDAPTFARMFRMAVDDAAEGRTSRRGVAGAAEHEAHTVSTQRDRSATLTVPGQSTVGPRWLSNPRTRSWLWRAVIAFAALNLVLAWLVMATQGELPPVFNRPDGLAQGVEARVHVDQLNLRTGPGEGSFVAASAGFGDRLLVAGESETLEGVTWWPVLIDFSGQEQTAWVWAGGIEPAGTGFPGWVQQATDGVRSAIGDTTGWRP